MNVMQSVFVVDGMLGSLARKIRVLGFDTLYYSDAEDQKLVEIGLRENRILLTCDRALFQRAMKTGLHSILLAGADELENLAHILKNLDINRIEFVPERSRCPVCNDSLEMIDKNSARDYVPAGVFERYPRFYFCRRCTKAYWEGSHFRKLKEFEQRVNRRLSMVGTDR